VDPALPRTGRAAARAYFGATVRYATSAGDEREVHIVGIDEVDLDRRCISWVSPLARALMKASAGDRVVLRSPRGTEQLEVLDVRYEAIEMEAFREPPGAESAPPSQQSTEGLRTR
jgi:transcription elongation factor GreB